MHHHFFFFPFFAGIIRLGITIFVFYVIYKCANRYFALNQEQNQLFGEIL